MSAMTFSWHLISPLVCLHLVESFPSSLLLSCDFFCGFPMLLRHFMQGCILKPLRYITFYHFTYVTFITSIYSLPFSLWMPRPLVVYQTFFFYLSSFIISTST